MRSVFRFHGSRLHVHIFALNPSDGSGYRQDLEDALGARFHSCSDISGVSCARLVNRQRIHTLCDLVGYTGGGEKANEVNDFSEWIETVVNFSYRSSPCDRLHTLGRTWDSARPPAQREF